MKRLLSLPMPESPSRSAIRGFLLRLSRGGYRLRGRGRERVVIVRHQVSAGGHPERLVERPGLEPVEGAEGGGAPALRKSSGYSNSHRRSRKRWPRSAIRCHSRSWPRWGLRSLLGLPAKEQKHALQAMALEQELVERRASRRTTARGSMARFPLRSTHASDPRSHPHLWPMEQKLSAWRLQESRILGGRVEARAGRVATAAFRIERPSILKQP